MHKFLVITALLMSYSTIGESSSSQDYTGQCPPGSISDLTGKYCCLESCGECGGDGCHKREGGPTACCTRQIKTSCDEADPPCYLSVDDSSEGCPNGGKLASLTVSGGCDVEVCCAASCEECDTSQECTEPEECCAVKIAEPITVSDVDVSCRDHDPPCVLPPSDDPCDDSPCENGARCGYAWQGDYASNSCTPRVTCACDEIGDVYSGPYCEIECGCGETPCGYTYLNYTTNVDVPNDTCCAVNEECLQITGKYGYSMQCYPYDRPYVCSPNPCLNGGSCSNVNYYGEEIIFACYCAEGFEGTFCENEVE